MQILQPTRTAPRASDTLRAPALRVSAQQMVLVPMPLQQAALLVSSHATISKALPGATSCIAASGKPTCSAPDAGSLFGKRPCQVRARLCVLCGHCVAACHCQGLSRFEQKAALAGVTGAGTHWLQSQSL